jgi:uncharacterized NAD(P)/FAD-binding protein YdhS
MSGTGPLPVAVIGAGFSGTMVALHLAATLPPDRGVLLFERDAFASGTAYATTNAGHLLNVRAANMSAFPDRPAHFEHWLAQRRDHAAADIRDTAAGAFVSRRLYGAYLTDLLQQAVAGAAGRLAKLPAEIVDLERGADGWRLRAADGRTHAAAGVVLAIGNLPPVAAEHRLHCANPWAPGVTEGLRPDLPVLILGTGLTMVDLALQLAESGFPGPVIALSRRGLPPQRHAPAAPWPTPALTEAERGSLSRLLARLRAEVRAAQAQGIGWRGVIDSLRPITSDIWAALPAAERERFLRHARPFWDVHRHRLAPPVADRLHAMLDAGFLRIARGRMLGMSFAADRVTATIRRRGAAGTERLDVQRVIRATGLRTAADGDSRLVRALCGRGLARLDAGALGLDVTERLEVRDGSGDIAPGLWALGPIVRGVVWECIAVPDIRVQAAAVARRINQQIV